MKLNHSVVQLVMKLCFSAVILQLLYISICAGCLLQPAETLIQPPYAYVTQVPLMLEYAAMSTIVTLGGALALEYALKTYS